jgi:HD-GYP domain-containing protein (c-di-GMP phosphodiesterase class II)
VTDDAAQRNEARVPDAPGPNAAATTPAAAPAAVPPVTAAASPSANAPAPSDAAPVDPAAATTAAPGTDPEYMRIALRALRVDTVTDFNIYLRQASTDAYTLYREAHLVFAEEHRQRLMDSVMDGVYISGSDRTEYVHYLETNLATIIADPEVPAEEESTIVYTCATHIVQDLLERPGQSEDVKRAQRMVDNTIEHLIKGPDRFARAFEQMSFDYRTYTHSVNVCVFGLALGQRLGFGRDELRRLGAGLLLHDIGKSRIDEAILYKRGPLSDEEWQAMRRHPDYGREILEATGELDPIALTIVHQHHEKCTGRGYPQGLHEPDIHLYSKICTLADVFDALTTERPYKQALDAFPALRIMQSDMREDFHPHLFREFIRMLGSTSVRAVAEENLRKAA